MRNHFLRCARLASLACALLLPLSVSATITMNLSYVDQDSTEYNRFKGWVDDAVAGDPGYAFSATDAAYMYKLTGQAQYAGLAVQMVEAQVSAAEVDIAAGNEPHVARDSYLYIGGMIGGLALTMDWCGAYVTQQQRTRWSAYAEQAVWNVWHHSDAHWEGTPQPWSGWGTDNPGNNYFYSFLQATAYWAYASNSTPWKNFLNNQKMPLLEAYFSALPGGGSQEGTGYGVSHARVFALYRMWRDNAGTDLANSNSHLTDSIYYWIHATVPSMDRVAPIGDQARVSEPVIYDYHRHLMLEARKLTNNASARNAATWWLDHISIPEMTHGANYLDDLLSVDAVGAPPLDLIYHATGVGQLFARTDWTTNAMWMNFSAGPFIESHAHQDQGAFTLFANGDWLVATENMWSHSGIHQQTAVHNVLRFTHNGQTVEQHRDTTSTMTVTSIGPHGEVHATANLTPAYAGEPAVQSWHRSIDFAGRHFVVHDSFALGPNTDAVFQVNMPMQPVISGNTAQFGGFTMRVLAPADATLNAVNWTTVDSDFNSGWRIDVSGSGNGFIVDFYEHEALFAGGFE